MRLKLLFLMQAVDQERQTRGQGHTSMVASEGSGQSLLMYTNAFWLLAHTAPLSKSCPAVRLAAVSRASGGPARVGGINRAEDAIACIV